MRFLVSIALFLMSSTSIYGHMHVWVEGLYWYTSETTDWGYTLKTDGRETKTDYKTFSFDWAPGIRLGIGYQQDESVLDTQFYYTKIATEAARKTKGPVTPAFMASRLSFLEPFSFGKARLHIDYNILDWEMGVRLYVTPSFLLHPAIGWKGGWIDQKIQSEWRRTIAAIPIAAQENLLQKFRGVGPKGAIQFQWNSEDFPVQLRGFMDVSYLWGYWSIKDRFTDNLKTNIFVKTNHRNFCSLVLHNFIGVDWKCAITALTMKFGYEMEAWLNQFQIFSNDSGGQNNNLIFQGITFGAELLF